MDYPLKSNNEILHFFEDNQTTEFVRALCIPKLVKPSKIPDRIIHYHFFRDSLFERPLWQKFQHYIAAISMRIMRLNPHKKRMYITTENGERHETWEGGQWIAITNPCLQYVVNFLNSKDYETYRKYFVHSYAPDEMFYATAIFNSPFSDKCQPWEKDYYPGLPALTSLHYIEYTNAIATYEEKDYDKLMSSGKLFARKFRTGVSDSLMDKIDEYRRTH